MIWEELKQHIEKQINSITPKVIEWRRHIHQNPELGNQEFNTANLVAEHLRSLGIDVKTGIAHTGVVGLLKGRYPGPAIALRADMDALPITEECDLPFASKVKAMHNGKETGVMHACGHDVHTANLMGVAKILSELTPYMHGAVKFIFQPAEESLENEETWGAKMMIEEGVLENPKVDAIFGLHVWPNETGTITLKPGPLMASVDNFQIKIKGQGTHGAMPWLGVDPIQVGSQIVVAMQSIVSRNIALNEGGAVITVGSFNSGNRHNVIPETATLSGTIRTHNEKARETIHQRIKELVELTAKAQGARAEVIIQPVYPTTINNVKLTNEMLPVLEQATPRLDTMFPMMPSEDFSYYLQKVPGFYFFLGIVPKGTAKEKIEANHSPRFLVDEDAIPTGMRALCYLAMHKLQKHDS